MGRGKTYGLCPRAHLRYSLNWKALRPHRELRGGLVYGPRRARPSMWRNLEWCIKENPNSMAFNNHRRMAVDIVGREQARLDRLGRAVEQDIDVVL